MALNELSRRAGDKLAAGYEKPSNADVDEFKRWKNEIKEFSALSIFITGHQGEQIAAQSEDIFDPQRLPPRVSQVTFHSSADLKTRYGIEPIDRFEVRFDFTETPSFFRYNPWQVPTPNQSRIDVVGNDKSWVQAVMGNVTDAVKLRRRYREWIHSPLTLTALLWVVGLPAALWMSYRCDLLIRSASPEMNGALHGGIVVYVALLALLIYRIVFGALRWMFPLMEIEGARSQLARFCVATVVLGIIASIIYDIIQHVPID